MKNPNQIEIGASRLIPSAFVLCLSSGVHELAVTRLASVHFFHDMAYLLVAICLLAMGTGAALSSTRLFSKVSPISAMIAWGFATSLCAVTSNLGTWAWWSGLFAAPMIVTGLFLALTYRRVFEVPSHPAGTGAGKFEYLYISEIAGFAIGLGIAGPLLLPHAGPSGTMAVSAILPGGWALLFTGKSKPAALVSMILAAAVMVLTATNWHTRGIERFLETGMTHLSQGVLRGELKRIASRWSAFARTDLARDPTGMALIYTDGMFCARAPSWNGEANRFALPREEGMAALKRVPYEIRPAGSVLVMGSGAGFDTAIALQHGAGRVEAVEVNPDMAAIASGLSGTTGSTYLDPRVKTTISEARKFAETFHGTVDHISLSLMETSPASVRGRSHVHASTLTVEAFKRYLSILNPGGIISVINNTRPFHDRCAAAAARASAPLRGGVISLTSGSDPAPDVDGNNFRHLLMVSPKPFTSEEIERIRSISSSGGWSVNLVGSPESYPTDERPFIFSGETLPLHGLAAMASGAALFCLLLPVAGAIALVGRRRSKGKGKKNLAEGLVEPYGIAALISISISLFLAAAGVSAAQVGLLHRAGQAIGEPDTATGVSLAAMVAGSGAGALWWGKFRDRIMKSSWGIRGLALGWGPCLVGFVLLGLTSGAGAAWLSRISNPGAGSASAMLAALFFAPAGLPFLEAMKALSGEGLLEKGPIPEISPLGIGLMADGCGAVFGTGIAVTIAPHLGISALFYSAAVLVAISGTVILRHFRLRMAE